MAEEVLLRFPQLLARLYVEPRERLLRFFFAARMDELQELVIDSLPPLLYWELLEAQLTAQHNMALGFFCVPPQLFQTSPSTMEGSSESDCNTRTTGAEKDGSA